MFKKPTEEESLAFLESMRGLVRRQNDIDRMRMILDLYYLGYDPRRSWTHPLNHWFQLLGENWTHCLVTQYVSELKMIVGVNGPIRQMMTEAENAAYDALPEVVTVYCGCDAKSAEGICWSLDERIANAFPYYEAFLAQTPVVIEARVEKNRQQNG
jgi:hypothetical protein